MVGYRCTIETGHYRQQHQSNNVRDTMIESLLQSVGNAFEEQTCVRLTQEQVVDFVCGMGRGAYMRGPRLPHAPRFTVEGTIPVWVMERVEEFMKKYSIQDDPEAFFREALAMTAIALNIKPSAQTE